MSYTYSLVFELACVYLILEYIEFNHESDLFEENWRLQVDMCSGLNILYLYIYYFYRLYVHFMKVFKAF